MVGAIVVLSLSIFAFAQMENNTGFNDTHSTNKTLNSLNHSYFHSNIEQMRGHVKQALSNKEVENNSLALAHTLHPMVEVYSLITQPLSQTNATLNTTLSNALNNLSSSVNTSRVDEFKQQAEEVNNLLNRSIDEVIPENIRDSSTHVLSVISNLLTISGQEYAEAVENGQIKEMIEYQDGFAFITRAQSLLDESSLEEDINQKGELNQMLSNLSNAIQNKEESNSIQNIIDQIITQISNITTVPQYVLKGN